MWIRFDVGTRHDDSAPSQRDYDKMGKTVVSASEGVDAQNPAGMQRICISSLRRYSGRNEAALVTMMNAAACTNTSTVGERGAGAGEEAKGEKQRM